MATHHCRHLQQTIRQCPMWQFLAFVCDYQGGQKFGHPQRRARANAWLLFSLVLGWVMPAASPCLAVQDTICMDLSLIFRYADIQSSKNAKITLAVPLASSQTQCASRGFSLSCEVVPLAVFGHHTPVIQYSSVAYINAYAY